MRTSSAGQAHVMTFAVQCCVEPHTGAVGASFGTVPLPAICGAKTATERAPSCKAVRQLLLRNRPTAIDICSAVQLRSLLFTQVRAESLMKK